MILIDFGIICREQTKRTFPRGRSAEKIRFQSHIRREDSYPMYDDWYHFEGDYVTFHSDPEQDRYEQIGDAIPPLLGYVLGKEVARTLHSIKGNGKEKTK